MAGFVFEFEAEGKEGATEALHFDPFGGFGYRDLLFGEVSGLAVFRHVHCGDGGAEFLAEIDVARAVGDCSGDAEEGHGVIFAGLAWLDSA